MISILVPYHNEEGNLKELFQEIQRCFALNKQAFEVIFIDDGSTDSSFNEVRKLQTQHTEIVALRNRKQSGKGEALRVGLTNARGDTIVFMDADLQDDPRDIDRFIEKLGEGYDLVNGIRINRKDSVLIKFYSSIANIVLHRIMKSPFQDINCGFKAMKKEVMDEMVLYGNNFRFLPLAVFYRGFRVSEIPVHNRERKHGVSKYGWKKLYLGMMDTLTAYFIFRFSERPLHFFGTVGLLFFSLGFFISLYLAIERIFFNVLLYRRPLLQLGILLIIIGIQIGMTGIIGELIVYLDKRKKKS